MPKTILYADDEESMQYVYPQFHDLEFQGVEIKVFEDGKSLCEELIKGISKPTVIVTDYNMPGQTGGEIINEFAEKYKDFARFILVSSPTDADETAQKQALRDGAFDYLLKPFRFQKLNETINRAFEDLEK